MELNILLDQLILANHIFSLHPKKSSFFVGFVDVDEDGGAGGVSALGLGIRADLRARRKGEHHCQNRDDYQAAEMSRGS